MNTLRSFLAPAAVVSIALLACAAGCGGAPYEPRPAPVIAPEVTSSGETVYFGTVFPLRAGAAEPSFVYERRVAERDGAVVSTHVTRDPSGVIALAESATHSPDYALAEYTVHANQLGQSGTVRVDGDTITFRLVDASGTRTSVERRTGAVVTGPTLVGYVVRHLDALREDKTVSVRMAVLDRLETLGFDLRAVPSNPGETRVRMKASSFLVAAVVDPVYFTFETATGKLLRLEGRVPPKVRAGDRWADFDARVEYRFVAASYR
jgi:hypothetical protein